MWQTVSIVWSFKQADALEVRELKKQRKCSAVVTFSCKSEHLSAGSNDGFQMARDGFPWVGRRRGVCRGCMCESFKCVHMWVKERAEEDVEKANICSLARSPRGTHPYACAAAAAATACVRACVHKEVCASARQTDS